MVVLMGFVPRKRFRRDGKGCRVGMVGQALDNDGFWVTPSVVAAVREGR